MTKTTIGSKEFQGLIIYSARYTLGRMTYAPHEVGDIIKRYLGKVENGTLDVLINDIEHQSQFDWGLGDDCDKKMWLALLDTLKNERDRRKSEDETV